MSAVAPTFRKKERMVSNLLIEALFDNGKSQAITAFPVRVVFQQTERKPNTTEVPVQVLISVPKKRFKHAVDRNRVKRQIREAYRHHKQILWERQPENQQLLLCFIWLSDRHYATKYVEKRIVSLLQRIAER